jgi:hypothetical protein
MPKAKWDNFSEEFETFLQDACMSLHDVWIDAGGRVLTPEELQKLNEMLGVFFEEKTPQATVVDDDKTQKRCED